MKNFFLRAKSAIFIGVCTAAHLAVAGPRGQNFDGPSQVTGVIHKRRASPEQFGKMESSAFVISEVIDGPAMEEIFGPDASKAGRINLGPDQNALEVSVSIDTKEPWKKIWGSPDWKNDGEKIHTQVWQGSPDTLFEIRIPRLGSYHDYLILEVREHVYPITTTSELELEEIVNEITVYWSTDRNRFPLFLAKGNLKGDWDIYGQLVPGHVGTKAELLPVKIVQKPRLFYRCLRVLLLR